MFILILAGGAGTRLWPQSRKSMPKQLLALSGEHTLIQQTVNRVLPITSVENIFFATNETYGKMIREQVDDLLARSIIAEPSGKNTAPCIGLAAAHMAQLDPDAIMVTLSSDHFIANEEAFRQAVLAAAEVAQDGYLVTLGIEPDKPETGYGYINRGASIGTYRDHSVYEVARFTEKPKRAMAEQFLAEGGYYWNSGMFVWKVSTLLDAFRAHMPTFADQLQQMQTAIKQGESIDPIWDQVESESIDIGIMERASKVAVMPIDIGWNDIGSWSAIYDINEADEAGNVALGTELINIDSANVLAKGTGQKVIATIGLEDVIIVETDDAILVCAKDKAQDTKQVVNWLNAQGRKELL